MGSMNFLLPADLSVELARELPRASVAAGQEAMPYPTRVSVEGNRVVLFRSIDESGTVLAPWDVDRAGRFMIATASLMERSNPYHLPIELARGRVNQLRGQAFDWLMGGLTIPPEVTAEMNAATHNLAQAVCQPPCDGAIVKAKEALAQSFHAADALVEAYVKQVIQLRRQRTPVLDTVLGCQLGCEVPSSSAGEKLADAFHAVSIPFAWSEIEAREGEFHWETCDRLVDWALHKGLTLIGGPLVDFSGARLPSWIFQKERDLGSLAGYLCDQIEKTVSRYRDRIRTWQLTASTNIPQVFAGSDEELLWLTIRLIEAVRNVDATLDIVIGVAQPCGEYLTSTQHAHSPWAFADMLIRTGVKLAAIDLELVMGVQPRGTYCRDRLDIARLLDLYALLGVPLHVTLGYPSSDKADDMADADFNTGAGAWRRGFSPELQADWANAFGRLAVSKPYVRAVQWIHWADAEPHLFPHCGLVDSKGNIKPALSRLQAIREEFLR